MSPHLPADHFCPWRDAAERLSARLDEVQQKLRDVEAKLEALHRRLFGKKSEKVPPVERELRKERPVDRAAVTRARADKAASKKQLVTEVVEHRVPDEQ